LIDPTQPVEIRDWTPDTLRAIIQSLHASSQFHHFIMREAELDAVYRLIDLERERATSKEQRADLERLLSGVMEAHDLVAEGLNEESASRLETLLAS